MRSTYYPGVCAKPGVYRANSIERMYVHTVYMLYVSVVLLCRGCPFPVGSSINVRGILIFMCLVCTGLLTPTFGSGWRNTTSLETMPNWSSTTRRSE